MEDVVYFNELYDLYGDLLTDKQREYFEEYYFNNLSYAEMAEDFDVSRNAIFKQLHITTDKLEEYESKYGPIFVDSSANSKAPWAWDDEPWPWEGK